jgi:hypothetical protein
MTQTLKHFAARIWFAVLIGGFISLWFLPQVQSRLGLQWTLLPVVAVVVLIFWVAGWISNLWAMSMIKRLVREAIACERDGMYPEAENAFRGAVAVFDSFLISPFEKQKKSTLLAARMARFYLARTDKQRESERFLVSYLYDHPEDEEVVENWMTQIDSRGGLKEAHQELAYRIGNAQPKNKDIQRVLARFYLLMERTDFPALQTYRRVFDDSDQVSPQFIENLSQLFLRERRADEWALKVYLQAIRRGGERSKLLRGLAACLRWTRATARNKSLRQQAYRYLEGIDEQQLKRMCSGFKPPAPPPEPVKRRRKISVRAFVADVFGRLVKGFAAGISAAVAWIARRVAAFFDLLKRSRKARRALASAVLAGLTAVVALLMINTLGYLTKTETAVQQKAKGKVVAVTDPFTIQVAAYLKSEHAHRYVAQLKKNGLDAYWTLAVSANKKWYQVRISHFADKQSARQYGESLKAKGIIEDFYVANYRRP